MSETCYCCGESDAPVAVEVKEGTDTDRGWWEWYDTIYLCYECAMERNLR